MPAIVQKAALAPATSRITPPINGPAPKPTKLAMLKVAIQVPSLPSSAISPM